MTDSHSSIANRDQNAKQPVLVLRPSTRALIGVICVMALLFVYTSLVAVGWIEMSRPTSGIGHGLVAILLFFGIIIVSLKARRLDYTKPIMVIGPDGITGQKLPKPIPWSMIERIETPQAGRAGLIYLTVRKDADLETLEHLHKWQPFQNRTFGIPHRVPGYSSSEVKDIVNRYFESSQRR
ncbi:hypothetical protein [Rhizobium leguminosarum]|uniref:hypothetical protein n=1 Tax=Rhizobium leguminosarum TaxID=384 RepID=UPI001622863E|nr:hypothetical protein [Rhizobium leguminosarum]MBB4510646.1 hypothetical protein [Rhizobium leguminosarum]